MLCCSEYIGDTLGLKNIAIQSGENNKWINEFYTDGTPHLKLVRAIKMYDDFAMRKGFLKDSSNNWYRPLGEFKN